MLGSRSGSQQIKVKNNRFIINDTYCKSKLKIISLPQSKSRSDDSDNFSLKRPALRQIRDQCAVEFKTWIKQLAQK